MKNICTMKNALNAYQKARRCKRYRPEVLEFEANREEYLGKAIRELESLTYTPGKYKVFKVWEPKERIIMALPFYDRVIQHNKELDDMKNDVDQKMDLIEYDLRSYRREREE